ncbi:MAG: hypothetical protein H0U97_12295 [Gammaproteobacteria bacterium]|nr:hypothetical protein [Gammaproteobacteria bacterium]
MEKRRLWLTLDTPSDRLQGVVFVFALFAVANRAMTGLPPAGESATDLILFYVGFLAFPVFGSILATVPPWFAVSVACLWTGTAARAPSSRWRCWSRQSWYAALCFTAPIVLETANTAS